jgi:NAD(P)-dependent dehydrogenase (short-subunit alcohol dehydrogenase family)
MEASLFGAWRCASEAVPLMSARGYGRIVNVSSPLGGTEGTAAPGSPAGQVSTAALVMLTQVLAAEVEFDGILVNAASPGCTRPPASPDAERPSDLAADTAVWLATLPDDGPTGRCFDADRQALAAGDRP